MKKKNFFLKKIILVKKYMFLAQKNEKNKIFLKKYFFQKK